MTKPDAPPLENEAPPLENEAPPLENDDEDEADEAKPYWTADDAATPKATADDEAVLKPNCEAADAALMFKLDKYELYAERPLASKLIKAKAATSPSKSWRALYL